MLSRGGGVSADDPSFRIGIRGISVLLARNQQHGALAEGHINFAPSEERTTRVLVPNVTQVIGQQDAVLADVHCWLDFQKDTLAVQSRHHDPAQGHIRQRIE